MDEESSLRSLIAGVRQRWFRQTALRTVGRAAAAAALPLAIVVPADYLLAPSGAWVVGLGAFVVVASLSLAVFAVRRAERRPNDRRVARFIEERAASLPDGRPMDDTLVSAVDVMRASDAPGHAFGPLIIAEATRRLSAVHASDIVDAAAIRRAAGQAIGGAVVLAIALVLGAPMLQRAVDTALVRYFPQSVRVAVTPGDARVPAGSALRIHAVLQGATRDLTTLAPALTVMANGERRTVEMTRSGDGFDYAFESVDRSFRYSITAGAARSAEYGITTLFPPKVQSIELRYEFPSFAGLAPRDEPDGGDIYGPAGTRVRVRVHTDKPTTSGALALGGAAAIGLRASGDRVLEGELVLRSDDSYRVKLADTDGLASVGDTEYFIRLMDDRPPDVRILRPSSDAQITPLEEVTIEARADDDYGIAAFDLVYAVGGGPNRVTPFDRITGTNIQKLGARVLPAEELGVRPGDVITYYARARDVGRGKRSTETTSDIFFLEVKPFAEEFVAAQSQAGAGAAAAQIESLIEAQKDIITATWNIERRAERGRSADDVKAVAQAQAELRARAEQMNGRSGRRPVRAPAPQRLDQVGVQPRPAVTDPIGAALEAMTRATQQLQEQRTKDAIPHEMAALNGLLQAQAEVRRRQVSQAQGGGGGGGNRQGQDLSALFDKELQRQQRTNYESRSQVEERPDQAAPNQDAADKIRDLARRQEDLSQRQRDLAAARVNEEEMKRQLEKLTREQSELRQQAEDLARQMSKPDASQQGRSGQQAPQGRASAIGQSGSPAQGQAQGAGSSAIRDASEQMRSAANDLGRDDPGAASKSGERAAQQLRRVEQQMRDATPQGGARASGELQLEAQQIAEEQRRIAAEAGRLRQTPGAAGTDAARRLADEKDRLAGRVDALQRSAAQVSSGKGPENAAAGDAAREIERQRIGQRMRETAKQMREPAQGQAAGGAAAEQQLAQAMDRIVDTLAGQASAETRQLSEQLNETRDIRDRLNRLEQQLRDAEAKQRGEQARAAESPRGRPGTQSPSTSSGQATSTGSGQGPGGAQKSDEVRRLEQQYQSELDRARQALGRLGDGEARNGMGGTPEQHEFSRSAPGTESFKQDRSGWESLRKNVDSALEKYEVSVSDRLSRARAAERFSAGGSERVPDSYRRLIAKYYESLAKAKRE